MHPEVIKCKTRSSDFSKLLLFFRFRRVGSDSMTSLSQSMISRYIEKYSALISERLGPKYIKFPQTEREIAAMKMKFEAAYDIPGIIGVVDGSHIALAGVPKDIEIPFINRKQIHTLNVQLICGPDLYILNVNARYPGSTHDSFIFRSSRVYTFLQDYYQTHNNEWTWLLGDSAYALTPWMMVIYTGNITDEEKYFNKRHQKVRNVIERCIGVLKCRFRCLLAERRLRYHPTKAAAIVNACATLHNFLIFHKYNINRDINVNEFENVAGDEERGDPINVNRQLGVSMRNELKDYLLLQRV